MRFTHDVVVIGAGSAGLTAAGGLAQLGLRVALIEAGRMGGECLHTGCVPSKALIAAARRAEAVRDAARFGIVAATPKVDFAAVRAHVKGAIAAIAPHDSVERFAAWGVEIVRGHARFLDRRTVSVGDRRLTAPRIVVATGSAPAIPTIDGLDAVPFLTSETLFDIADLPKRLLVLGGGSIGCEIAQAFRRLGSDVAVVERERLLGSCDAQAAALVADRLRREGVVIMEQAEVLRVDMGRSEAGAMVRLTLAAGASLDGTHLLIATGRAARLDGLDCAAADIATDRGGIRVDRRLRTSAPGIYAIGDCRAGPRFTHAAGYDGSRIVAALGFGLPASVDYSTLPRVTYTDPELAEAGVSEAEARSRGGPVEATTTSFADNDRAVTEADTVGFCSIVRQRRRIVGAMIVGAGAGDLLMPWILAMSRAKPSLWALSSLTLPYPTRSEITKAAAFAVFEHRIFSAPARLWARTLAALRRLPER